jgi:hypothetical protein
LTLGELNSLVKTDCKSPEVKIQALFSALTGLMRRYSKLIWEEVQYVEGYLYRFKQKKTGVQKFADNRTGLWFVWRKKTILRKVLAQ